MLSHTRRGSLVWLLILASACASPASPTEVGSEAAAGAAAPADVTASLVQLTNSARSSAGISLLRPSGRLTQAAQLQADQMARVGQLAHVLSGAPYPRPEDRLATAGYDWRAYAENIAMGQGSVAAAMDSWMHSSGHRANILHTGMTEIGIGLARDSAGRPYYVQVFGTPRS